jgi:membrane protein CcdC involved in cytochrome C biogenesis
MQLPAHLVFGPVAALAGAAAILAWRVRESTRPVTAAGLVLPPLAMSTGFAMFALPAFRIPWSWAAGAFLAGALLFSWPLFRTSTLQRAGDVIVMRRSRAFLWILLGLVAVRLGLRTWIDHFISPTRTGALFFVIAFGMIAVWRVRLLLAWRALRETP